LEFVCWRLLGPGAAGGLADVAGGGLAFAYLVLDVGGGG